MVNILCTTLLVIASLHVGLVYPLKSSSRIELETHEAAAEEDVSKQLADLEKELNAIIEDADVDNDNKEEVLDADKSFMQDRYDEDEDGMTQDDEDEDGMTQDDEDEDGITQDDEDEDGMSQDDEDGDGMSQDDEDVSSSQDDSKPITSQNDDEKLTIQRCR